MEAAAYSGGGIFARARLMLTLVAVGLTLLTAAWTVATKPFGGPDENAHYLRALSIANGSLLGPRVPYHPDLANRAALAWVQHDARGVLVLPRLSPLQPINKEPAGAAQQPTLCVGGKRDTSSGGCVEPTWTGDYPPLPYLLPALALTGARSASSGLWSGRALSASACLAFLLLAMTAVWDGSGWSLLGPLLAVTPMLLFVSSIISPSGLETAASVAFATAGLRIVRDPCRSPAWIWILLVVAGAATLLAWQLGPVFVAIDLAVFAALLGARTRGLWVTARRRVIVATVVLSLALCLYVIWSIASGASHGTFRISPLGHSLSLGTTQLTAVFRGFVGVFGWGVVRMRSVFYWIWWLLVGASVLGAILLGGRRQRNVTVCVAILAVVAPVVFYAWVYRFSGFPLQGRYMLPLLVLVPLVAGEVIRGARSRMPARTSDYLLASAMALVALGQLAGWWTSARAAAAVRPYTLFMRHATWTPPLGWWPWVALAIAGSAAIAASATVLLRTSTARVA